MGVSAELITFHSFCMSLIRFTELSRWRMAHSGPSNCLGQQEEIS